MPDVLPPALLANGLVVAVGADDVGDGAAAEVRHADDLHRRRVVDRVDRDDVGVLEAGEPFGLLGRPEGDLERDRPAGERFLARQEHAGERPLPKLLHQLEPEERVADTQADAAFLGRSPGEHRARQLALGRRWRSLEERLRGRRRIGDGEALRHRTLIEGVVEAGLPCGSRGRSLHGRDHGAPGRVGSTGSTPSSSGVIANPPTRWVAAARNPYGSGGDESCPADPVRSRRLSHETRNSRNNVTHAALGHVSRACKWDSPIRRARVRAPRELSVVLHELARLERS